MTKVVVYQTPACVQCRQTKVVLDRHKIVYDVIDLTQHPESMEMVKRLGYTAAPVVVATDKHGNTSHWSGFRLNKLDQLKSKIHGEEVRSA